MRDDLIYITVDLSDGGSAVIVMDKITAVVSVAPGISELYIEGVKGSIQVKMSPQDFLRRVEDILAMMELP